MKNYKTYTIPIHLGSKYKKQAEESLAKLISDYKEDINWDTVFWIINSYSELDELEDCKLNFK